MGELKRLKLKFYIRIAAAALAFAPLFACAAPAADPAAAGLTSGGVYHIRNKNSGKYLNVNLGRDADKTNVIQWTKDGSVEQRFLLEYAGASDSYRLRAMCSGGGGNRVVDVYRAAGAVRNGCDVDIWTPTDAAAQQWLITGLGGGYYKITLRSYPNLALTAYGTANGSGAGTSATSMGNVFLSAYTGDAGQQWAFERQNTNKYADLGWSYFFRGGNAKYVGGYYHFNHPAGHLGIDVLAPAGTAVYSVTGGRVRSSYTAVNGGNNIYITPDVSPAGEKLDIGMYHFKKRNVATGAVVTENTVLGAVGSTGNSTAPHAHLEISRVGKYTTHIEDHINPELFYPDIEFTHTGQTKGGGTHRQMMYTLEYGAIPDSIIRYAKEENEPAAVQAYLDAMYARYQSELLSGNPAVENELLKFMKEFGVPKEAAAERLDNVYTRREFRVICRDDRAQLNKTFVNDGYAYYSSRDGKIYTLDALVQMDASELRQRRLSNRGVRKLVERNMEGVYDYEDDGRAIVSEEEVEALRERID